MTAPRSPRAAPERCPDCHDKGFRTDLGEPCGSCRKGYELEQAERPRAPAPSPRPEGREELEPCPVTHFTMFGVPDAAPPPAPTRPEDEPIDLDTLHPSTAEFIPLAPLLRAAPPAPTRDGTLPFPDDAGPRCDACKGRGWVPGDCHPREVCGTCNGTGYPKSWAAEEIDRLDREVARLRALQSEARAAALHEAADHLDRIAPYAEDQQTTFNAQGCAREVRLLASAPPRAETGREEGP
jgi:hypothetical protein